MDGHRTISDIVDAAISGSTFARADTAEVESVSLETFRSLWQQDFLATGIHSDE